MGLVLSGWRCHLECESHSTCCVHWAQRWQCYVDWFWLHGFLWEWESVRVLPGAACWWCENFQMACCLPCLLSAWMRVLKQSKREAVWWDKNMYCLGWWIRQHFWTQMTSNISQTRNFFLRISWIIQCETLFATVIWKRFVKVIQFLFYHNAYWMNQYGLF